MLDEPSLGLAPSIVETLFGTIRKIKSVGVTVLLVEQNLWDSLEIADRYYLIASGRIVSTGVPGKLRNAGKDFGERVHSGRWAGVAGGVGARGDDSRA